MTDAGIVPLRKIKHNPLFCESIEEFTSFQAKEWKQICLKGIDNQIPIN